MVQVGISISHIYIYMSLGYRDADLYIHIYRRPRQQDVLYA